MALGDSKSSFKLREVNRWALAHQTLQKQVVPSGLFQTCCCNHLLSGQWGHTGSCSGAFGDNGTWPLLRLP